MKIIAYAYYYLALLKMFATYSKQDLRLMYATGMLGTEEGKFLRKLRGV